MIWFACKQCGKAHGRPESSSGMFVFCECGQGNTVPWESTIAEPPPAAPATPPPLDIPTLAPIPVAEEHIPVPARPAPPPPPPSSYPPPLPPNRPAPQGRRPPPHRRFIPPRDSSYCLNHQKIAFEKTCADCGERFCQNCVVSFRGKMLCGPCKNAEIEKVDRPPRISGLAIGALICGLVLSPAGACLFPLGGSGNTLPLMLGAIIFQLGAFLLGGLALYKAESDPQIGGKSLAITAMLTAGVSAILTGGIAMLSYGQWL